MKRIFKRIIFNKTDEMQKSIIFKAQRNSYIFLIIALLIWSLYETYQAYSCRSKLNLVPCLLLAAACIIQAFSQLILTRSAVKDDEDSYETEPLIKIVLLICAVVGVTVTAIAAILLMGINI